MSVAICAIGEYIPANRESNFNKQQQFEIDEDFIYNKIGVHSVSRKLDGEKTSDLCIKAYQDLLNRNCCPIEMIDCIVVCTQTPDGGGIPHVSAIVHGVLGGRDDCAVFDISLGCSGYVYGLSVMKSFMEANGLQNGLFFTADPYSVHVDSLDKDTSLLFGDAATVTFLSSLPREADVWYPSHFVFGTKGKQYDALHNKDGKLVMNGRAIFNFAAISVPVQIRSLLEKASTDIDDIDLFLFHQGSEYILDTLRSRLNLQEKKVPLYLSEQGNTVSSSIPLLLKRHFTDNDVSKMVLSGFGVGLSWASCLLQRSR